MRVVVGTFWKCNRFFLIEHLEVDWVDPVTAELAGGSEGMSS